jgi:hypothetical protein
MKALGDPFKEGFGEVADKITSHDIGKGNFVEGTKQTAKTLHDNNIHVKGLEAPKKDEKKKKDAVVKKITKKRW